MRRSLALVLALAMLPACNTEDYFRRDYASNRLDGAGKPAGKPPMWHDEDPGNGERDSFDESFDDPYQDEKPADERSFQRQLAEQQAREMYEDARAHADRAEYVEARKLVRKILRYRTSVSNPARVLLAEVDDKLRAAGKDPYTAELDSMDKGAVARANKEVADGIERGAQLLRDGSYDRATSEYELALRATNELPDTIATADTQFQLRSLLRFTKYLKAQAGLDEGVR